MDRNERTKKTIEDPAFMDEVCDQLANGGCAIELCKTRDIRYSDVMRWIDTDPARRKRYDSAISARSEWVVQTILKELKTIATIDLRRAYDDSGQLLEPRDMPDDIARVLSGVDVQENIIDGEVRGYTKKIKLWDKLRALELLGKTMALFVDRHEHSGKVTLEDLVVGSMATLQDGEAASRSVHTAEIPGSNPGPAK
jgi:hypothetical protein